MMKANTAIVIVNYNMPERTDALAEAIFKNIDKETSYDLIVVDNGSDIAEPSVCTNLELGLNVQTTNGWLMGLSYADALATFRKYPYDYYWFLITSTEFVNDRDPLTPVLRFMEDKRLAVGVHHALARDSTTMWKHLKDRGTGGMRQTHMIDNISSIYRADWFNSIGRFDRRLTYAAGIDIETCWKARQEYRSLWVYQDVSVKKITDIGYKMNRMNESVEARRQNQQREMDKYLIPKYGPDYWKRLLEEGVTDDMR